MYPFPSRGVFALAPFQTDAETDGGFGGNTLSLFMHDRVEECISSRSLDANSLAAGARHLVPMSPTLVAPAVVTPILAAYLRALALAVHMQELVERANAALVEPFRPLSNLVVALRTLRTPRTLRTHMHQGLG